MSSSKPSMPAVRVFSYSVAGVLGLLLTSSTMPSVFSASSHRALINAPTQLVTAPIKGVVTEFSLSAGDRVQAGQRVGHVKNDEVGREKLIELEIKASELTNDLVSTRAALTQVLRIEQRLEGLVEQQSEALIIQLQSTVESASARLREAEAQIAISQDQGARDQTLLTRGVLGGTLVRSNKIIEAVTSQRDVAAAELAAASQRLDVARQGIFLGSDNGQVNNLLIELRENENRSAVLRAEIDVLKGKLADVSALREVERLRVSQLMDQEIAASGELLVTRVGVSQGAAVGAGDTLAQGVDCRRAFVVAIFPERSAGTLATGKTVTVSSADWDEPLKGVVSSLVPRTTNAEDVSYAVPFPPTERRELYAYIDIPGGQAIREADACSVGRWVTVSLDGEGVSAERLIAGAGHLWTEGTQVAARGVDGAAGLVGGAFTAARPYVDLALSQARYAADWTTKSAPAWLRNTFTTEAAATEVIDRPGSASMDQTERR